MTAQRIGFWIGLAGMLATLVGAVGTNPKENEYFFKKDIIFSAKSFAAMGEDRFAAHLPACDAAEGRRIYLAEHAPEVRAAVSELVTAFPAYPRG